MQVQGSSAAKITLGLIMVCVGIMGLSAFVTGSKLIQSGSANRAGAIAAVVMGAVLLGLSATYFYNSLVLAPRRAAILERTQRQHPGQPWMLRPDWSARRVEYSDRGRAVGVWIWVVGWCGGLGIIGTVNYDKIAFALAQSWGQRAILVLFLLAAIAGLLLAMHLTVRWWRYGTTMLHLDTLPAYLGDHFRGTIVTRLPAVRLPMTAELRCEEIRSITDRRGKRRTTRTDIRILGRTKTAIDPRQFVPDRVGRRGTIEIEVPANLPEFNLDTRGDGIRWILEVTTAPEDASFSCAFEVPVYARR